MDTVGENLPPQSLEAELVDLINAVAGRRVAVVHEWVSARAGSEQVFEHLAQMLPDADLYALSVDPSAALQLDGRKVQTTFLNWPIFRARRGLTLPLMPIAWRLLGRARYDVVITSHHAFARSNKLVVRTGLHVVYVHTPARYIWTPEIDSRGSAMLLRPARSVLKRVDRLASSKRRARTVNIANSFAVQDRIRKYWDDNAEVVFPPVRVEYFGQVTSSEPPSRDYLFGFSRWVSYKRLDLVIRTAKVSGDRVILAGSGPEREHLRDLALTEGVDVTFVESPTDDHLRDLYRNAKALIFPAVEDFGMVPVEAQAAGTPVIGLDRGGLRDTVLHGETGFLTTRASPDELAHFVGRASELDANNCRSNAARFSRQHFTRDIADIIRQHLPISE